MPELGCEHVLTTRLQVIIRASLVEQDNKQKCNYFWQQVLMWFQKAIEYQITLSCEKTVAIYDSYTPWKYLNKNSTNDLLSSMFL